MAHPLKIELTEYQAIHLLKPIRGEEAHSKTREMVDKLLTIHEDSATSTADYLGHSFPDTLFRVAVMEDGFPMQVAYMLYLVARKLIPEVD